MKKEDLKAKAIEILNLVDCYSSLENVQGTAREFLVIEVMKIIGEE